MHVLLNTRHLLSGVRIDDVSKPGLLVFETGVIFLVQEKNINFESRLKMKDYDGCKMIFRRH